MPQAAQLARNAPRRKPVQQITDRAKRYRANARPPRGPRVCALCGSRRFIVIDHRDGNESNGSPRNLRYLCKSCNNRLGARNARLGRGVPTRQFNPGAKSLAAYVEAGLMHQRGAHDYGGSIIHETPIAARRKFAAEIWRRRRGLPPEKVKLNPRNAPPYAEAVAAYTLSHGRPPREVLDEQRSDRIRKIYFVIGEAPSLDELEIAGPECDLDSINMAELEPEDEIDGAIPLSFDGDGVNLAADPKGRQLYLIGGSQELDAADLRHFDTDTSKDLIALGPALSVTYWKREGRELERYRHFLGEKSGEQPIAFYDRLKKEIGLVGGRYYVKDWIYD